MVLDGGGGRGDPGWDVRVSRMARHTFNPIRSIVDGLRLEPHPGKDLIALSVGDPTVFGNLAPPRSVVDAVAERLFSGQSNGYGPSAGTAEARAAVAEHASRRAGKSVRPDDVFLASGCSGALDLCISALANPGDNLLVPRPGFPLYATLAGGLGVATKEYDLVPERDWEVDLDHLASLFDARTRAVVVNNPSNPCGSVYDARHLRQILDVCEAFKVPVIADEIYEHMVFEGARRRFVPAASLTEDVPVLSCGGIAKRYLVPGWRLGWIAVHDAKGVLERGGVREGLLNLTQRLVGPNTLVQGALPSLLRDTPETFFQATLKTIEENAAEAHRRLRTVPGLSPSMPQGAMYMMVGVAPEVFPDFASDVSFVEALVREQSVFCLPGKCFRCPNYVRIVLTVPKRVLIEACDRIEAFCRLHAAQDRAEVEKPLSGDPFSVDRLGSPSLYSSGASSAVASSGSSPLVSRSASSDERELEEESC